MTDWRKTRASLLLAAALGLFALPAIAQPSAPEPGVGSEFGPETGPATQPETQAAPQSPEEERAQRRARLDALFAQLAQKEHPDWQRIQDQIWSTWLQSGSPSYDLLMQRANKAMQERDFELALKFLNDLVRLAPDYAEGWNKRATTYFLLEEYGHSVADIQRTLALEPRHFGALFGLGMILEQLGDKPGAMRAYRAGLEVHPNLPGAAEGVERLSPDVDGREL
jgi:tetratricopeptide (TPR) repeat protein